MVDFIIFLNDLENEIDNRQKHKVKHKLSSIFLVLICLLQDIKTFVEMEFYATEREQFLKQYIDLDGGIPSHDTIRRAMGMINPSVLEKIQQKMTEYQVADEIERKKQIKSITIII